MPATVTSRALTIYLAKEGRERNSLVKTRDGAKKKQVPVGKAVMGTLLIDPAAAKPPSWASFFEGYVDPREFGKVSSSSAVLLVPVRDRWMAVAFGQGRHLLAPDAFEDRFGLRVALNCIDEKKIRSIDKQTFDAIARHTLEQATHEATAGEFGFDIERDLLRAVTGTPRNNDYGKRMSGMDALNVSVRNQLNDLYDLLEIYQRKFFDDSYRDPFPWVDQIAYVSDPTLETSLNNEVIKLLREKQFDRCWLAVPDILDWSRVSGFRYSQANWKPEVYDIHLPRFMEYLKDPTNLSLATLKTRRLYCMGDDDSVIKSWTVFNCLYCELDQDGKSYVLNAGKWYIMENDFVRQVNESFSKVPIYAGTFLDYDDDNEARYNERLVKLNPDNYCLMDRNLTHHGGSMEFCDIFSKAKELIHIKRYGGSATLSHLFYQGVNSAEFFQMDSEYRKLVREKLSPPFRIFNSAKRPQAEEYHIVFGIISRSDKPLTMPFFSRVGIRHALRRLQGFGYKVSLAKIGVATSRKVFQKIRPRPIRN
jgi:uncharacterized protein (TIGR04141 family)